MKDNIIIINAFPNNDKKILLLGEQISYLKQLNIPIMVISGCNVPEFIQKNIQYLIINTENDIIGKDFFYLVTQNGLYDGTASVIESDFFRAQIYEENVNSTITKNIKLSFNLAKQLGYKTAFYTEDDNIWKNGSFFYISNLLDSINNKHYKMSGVLGVMSGFNRNMLFTTFFSADINYFCEHFILPENKQDWYDINQINKFKLHRPYEEIWFNLFENQMNLFYDTRDIFINDLLNNKPEDQHNLAWGIYKRYHNIEYVLKNCFTILPSNNEKILLIHNNGTEDTKYSIMIRFDNGTIIDQTLNKYEFFLFRLHDDCLWVELSMEGKTIRKLTDNDTIKNNGIIEFF